MQAQTQLSPVIMRKAIAGAIKITGGNFNLTAGNDGIKSAQILEIEDGEFNITTGGGSENASMNSNGKPNENWGRWGGNMPDYAAAKRRYGKALTENQMMI